MDILPITGANIEGVWRLFNDTAAECDRLPLAWLRFKILDDPDPDAGLRLAAIENGRPVAFMDAACREEDGNLVGYLKAWGTVPEFRDRKIATELLTRIEDRFRARGVSRVQAGQAKPHYYTPGIDPASYTRGIAFLLRRGFAYHSQSYNMDVPLSGRTFADTHLEGRLAGQGITVRRVLPGEKSDFVRRVIDEGWTCSWQYQCATAATSRPPAAFIAEGNGRLLGFAVYDAVRPAWFGPTGTSEDARGSGIGSVLFLRCLDDMRDRGYPVCHIGAVGPLYFYAKVADAAVSRSFWHMRKDL